MTNLYEMNNQSEEHYRYKVKLRDADVQIKLYSAEDQ